MDRRSFVKLAGLAGLSVAMSPTEGIIAAPKAAPRKGYSAYTGPCFIFVDANGGWDPTHLCDPKPTASLEDPKRLTNYLESQVGTAGVFRYAPGGINQMFFEKHHSRLMVINGVDTQTNGHDSGSRNVFSGRLADGYPSLAAMIAGAYDPGTPMAFLSFGGYDETNGLVARTRAGNVSALSRLAFPGRSNPEDAASGYHSEASQLRIAQAQAARDQQLLMGASLPRERKAMNTLFTARTGSNELALLQSYLPEELDNTNELKRQAQLVLAAYRAGICISANLSTGGFDTHGNHDNQHIPALQRLMEGIDFLWDEAVRQEVADRIVIMVGSDFGRTPQYNDQQGKDHWAITSVLLMGAQIPGNRIVGLTDGGHVPLELDPVTLQPAAGGIRIEPCHIHRALRTLAGINGSDLAASYPLDGQDLPLFG